MRYATLLMTTGVILSAEGAQADTVEWVVYSPADKVKVTLPLDETASVSELATALKKYCGAQGDVQKALLAGRRGVSPSSKALELDEFKVAPDAFKFEQSAPGTLQAARQRAAIGYVKLGDIKGEAGTQRKGFVKLGDIKGEANRAATGRSVAKSTANADKSASLDVAPSPADPQKAEGNFKFFRPSPGGGGEKPKKETQSAPAQDVFIKVDIDPYSSKAKQTDRLVWTVIDRPSDQCVMEKLYFKVEK